jgi:hypothetical protein
MYLMNRQRLFTVLKILLPVMPSTPLLWIAMAWKFAVIVQEAASQEICK